jgi:hypothetical protein
MKLIFAGHDEVAFGCYGRQLPIWLGPVLSRLSAFHQLSSETPSSQG